MINANIDVEDGLANVSHIELGDQNRVLRFLFPSGVGVKARGKVAGYANAKEITIEMVPINRRSAKFLSTKID
ncbi:hypothetical protein TNCT_318091 [Trichonephila clavata]|uniref:Uncharacterized protein n=1 Tax=Trichonephila clavata TaxID=2740835 RepID=A0A8X6LPH2_TRICU|nr:hypothetical protein TNCT_318091 [Trichonephila clavata]